MYCYVGRRSIHGLPNDGEPIITKFEPFVLEGDVCPKYEWVWHFLGSVSPENSWKGNSISLRWLKREFRVLSPLPTSEDLVYSSRAYILRLLGGVFFIGNDCLFIHVKYLLFLKDLRNVDRYSWGSAVLTCLYRFMSRGTDKATVQLAGPMLLLQCLIWIRMPFLLAHRDLMVVRDPWPIVFGTLFPWTDETQSRGSHEDLRRWQAAIDELGFDDFIWCPYVQNRFPTAVALI